MYESMKPEKRNYIIERILRVEWEMLKEVKNVGGKADCQDEWPTFHIMRYSYYNAWSDKMLRSYIKDLDEAINEKRNLVMEKYAYMMEYTDLAYYNSKLLPFLPKVDEEKTRLVNEIADYLVDCDKQMALKYPKLIKKGRPIEAYKDNEQNTSAESYSKGELKTYTTATLKFFLEHINECKEKHLNFAYLVMDKMVKMYGYDSIEAAELKS